MSLRNAYFALGAGPILVLLEELEEAVQERLLALIGSQLEKELDQLPKHSFPSSELLLSEEELAEREATLEVELQEARARAESRRSASPGREEDQAEDGGPAILRMEIERLEAELRNLRARREEGAPWERK